MRREIAQATAIFAFVSLWLTGHRWINGQVDFTPNAARSAMAYEVPRPSWPAFEPLAGGRCAMSEGELAAHGRDRKDREALVAGWLKLAIDFSDRGEIVPAMRLCREILKVDRREPMARRILDDLRTVGRIDAGFRLGHVQAWLSAQEPAEPLGD